MTQQEKLGIKQNIDAVRENIEKYRDKTLYGGDITVMCATKTVDVEKIKYAVECGITHIGENHVQELLSKYEQMQGVPVKQSFIGTLQTNKVRFVVDKVDLIQSVDSVRLASYIDRYAEKAGKVADILLEYNSGNEPNKGGILKENFDEIYHQIKEMKNINIRGMMTMAPKCEKKCEYEKYFSQTYQIFIDFFAKKVDNIYEPILSMGMSDSYEQAVKYGATMIRPGSAIFGKRNYNT